jgi:hypothetical protein
VAGEAIAASCHRAGTFPLQTRRVLLDFHAPQYGILRAW